jgi:hypothetical protein
MAKPTVVIEERPRQIVHRTRGRRHGSITRLMSPSGPDEATLRVEYPASGLQEELRQFEQTRYDALIIARDAALQFCQDDYLDIAAGLNDLATEKRAEVNALQAWHNPVEPK